MGSMFAIAALLGAMGQGGAGGPGRSPLKLAPSLLAKAGRLAAARRSRETSAASAGGADAESAAVRASTIRQVNAVAGATLMSLRMKARRIESTIAQAAFSAHLRARPRGIDIYA